MRKKLGMMTVVVMMLFGLMGLSGCSGPYDPFTDTVNPVVESECGNFYVQLYNEDRNEVEKGNAVVIGLTEAGKEKEIVIIPSQVEGMNVTQIGLFAKTEYGFYPRSFSINETEDKKLKKIYVPNTIVQMDWLETGFTMPKAPRIICDEIIFFSISPPKELAVKGTILVGVFFGEETRFTSFTETKPNLIYYYNYQNAPNEGYYWLDYLTGENLFIDPPSPTREGCTFIGWFLEPECTTRWSGVLPSSADETLNLYAGWN